MKKNNPPKKLRFFKKTIAHLTHEQMYAVHGGLTVTERFCTNSIVTTNDCDTTNCPPTQTCA